MLFYAYGRFTADDGSRYGSFEVFHSSDYGHDVEGYSPGWYWWACFPGCLPDGDPVGPFDTPEEAYADARESDG